MATQVLSQIANYLATVPLQRKQQQYENELANRRLALQEDEAKRKAEADALALEKTQFEQQQRNEGQQQLRDYYQAAEIQPAINELKQGKELTKNVAPYSMDYLLAQPEATPLALTDKYKLSQYSGYNEGVKSTLEQLNKKNEVEQKQVRAPGVYGARLDAFRTNPNAVPELIQSIENYHDIGKLKDQDYNYLMARVKTDPVQASLAMDDIVIKPLVAGETISAQTDPKVEQKYKLIAPEAATSETTSYSKEIGGAKGRRDVPDATGMTNIDPNTGEIFTNQQKTDAQFAIKLQRSNNVLDKLASGNFDESSIDKVLLSNVDQNGNIKVNVLNELKDPKLRRYAQAKLDFVMSTLRKESGAAISAGEYIGQSARYFPQAGDDSETLEQKRNARITEEASYQAAAGDAAMKYFNDKVAAVHKERPSPYKKPTEPAAVTTQTKKYSDAAIQQAKEALNDPNAPETIKARARKVLGQ